jgi:hypothetical protein
MRELIERFSYRFQLWKRERYGDRGGADPTALRNPLWLVALVVLVGVVTDAAEPFLFHRAFDAVSAIRVAIALAFLILYQSKSRWAWHVVVAWLPFAFFSYWTLRFAGYSRYQPRVHSPMSAIVTAVVDVVITAALLLWFFRIRDRYFRYIQYARRQQT